MTKMLYAVLSFYAIPHLIPIQLNMAGTTFIQQIIIHLHRKAYMGPVHYLLDNG